MVPSADTFDGVRAAGFRRVDAVDTEHRRGVQHVAGAVADLVRNAGPRREIAVARAVDEHAPADREAARFRLDEDCLDAVVGGHDGARRERMKQHVHVRFRKQLVGRNLERRDVVGLRENLVLDREVRLVEAAHRLEARENVVGEAVHDLLVFAVDDGMEAAEGAQAGRGARAAEKAVALDANRRPPRTPRGDRRRDAGRSPADDDDFIVAVDGCLPAGLEYVGRWHAMSLVRDSRAVCRGIPRESR